MNIIFLDIDGVLRTHESDLACEILGISFENIELIRKQDPVII